MAASAGEGIRELGQSGSMLGLVSLLCPAERKKDGAEWTELSPCSSESDFVMSLTTARHQVPSSGSNSPLSQLAC